MKYQVTVEGQSFEIEIDHERLVRVNGRPVYIDLEQISGLPLYSLALDDEGYIVFVEDGQGQYHVEVGGQVYPVQVRSQRPQLAARPVACAGGEDECLAISAPLAGNLVSLPVSVGERVEAGQAVAVVESMKMQMELRAPQTGVVETVHGPQGRNVDQGEQLVILTMRA